ncbi:MAG: hypothetical protein ACQEQF_05935 [Bacillota bacterium]
MPYYKISAIQTVKEEIENVVKAEDAEKALAKAKCKEFDFLETAKLKDKFGASTIEAIDEHKVEKEITDTEGVKPMEELVDKIEID